MEYTTDRETRSAMRVTENFFNKKIERYGEVESEKEGKWFNRYYRSVVSLV